MNDTNPWDDAFRKAEEEFSETQAAMDSKERIFTGVMSSISSNPIAEMTFQKSLEYVEKIAEDANSFMKTPQHAARTTQLAGVGSVVNPPRGESISMSEINSGVQVPSGKRRDPQPTRKSAKKPLKIGKFLVGAGAVAAAAVLVTVGLNREPKAQPVNYETLDPKVVQAALEKLPIDAQSRYVTIAANKHFQLGYLDSQAEKDVIQVVISANTADIDWDSFYATNQNNDLIQPLSIDKENNIITLEPTQSEIQMEISDCDGNFIECTIADDLQEG